MFLDVTFGLMGVMGIIFRYITKELYTTLLGILMVLLIIFMSNQFVAFSYSYAASGHITMNAVMQLMSLQIPFLLGYLMPLGLYLSILIVFGRLYLDHEMTVMSACGVSPNSLLAVVLAAGVVVAVIVAGLMLWLEPLLDSQRIRIFYESMAKATVEKVMPKRFQTLVPIWFFMRMVWSVANSKCRIFFSRKEANRNRTAAVHGTSLSPKRLRKLIRTRWPFSVISGWLSVYRHAGFVQLSDYTISILWCADGATGIRRIRGWPSNASTGPLWPQRHNPKVAAELHWRMAMPVSALVLSLLAFPLSRINPRRGKFSQLIPAILLYICMVIFYF